ncbi:hypothetical protein MC885_001825, partial [Smutsia gigantea]
ATGPERLREHLHPEKYGLCQSKALADDENASKDPIFNPQLVIAHCFKQFKQEGFHLPQSRRRIIILPQKGDPVPVNPMPQPQSPPQSTPTFRVLEAGDTQEQLEDTRTWLSRRLKLRQDLESFGNTERWLQHKPCLTPSEAKVLQMIRKEHEPPLRAQLLTTRATKKKCCLPVCRAVPQLQLPEPSALLALYSYLHGHKIKILEIFSKVTWDESISREEFIVALKSIRVPLKNQEVEDIVIYLSSLGKQNTITTDILANSYKQWSLAQQRSTMPTAREHYRSDMQRASPQSPSKNQKLTIPSIQYAEQCRLVRSGNKHFDEHCLPSTISGEMKEVVNMYRRDNFLAYLQCWKLCEYYGLPLTEDILMKALLYPGDKIIFHKDQVRPIRQPGGYYSDSKVFGPNPALLRFQGFNASLSRKTDKLSVRAPFSPARTSKKIKKIHFKEFEEFTRKLKAKRPSGPQRTHPNLFWPGHLLDKLRLYLPTVPRDRSLALFSCVQPPSHAYAATCHPNHWWPTRNMNNMTCAYCPRGLLHQLEGPGWRWTQPSWGQGPVQPEFQGHRPCGSIQEPDKRNRFSGMVWGQLSLEQNCPASQRLDVSRESCAVSACSLVLTS